MAPSLAQRLRAAHHERFVGREQELQLFTDALDAREPPFYVLYLHGPGGIGKTALAHELRYQCDERDVPTHHLDARNVEPTEAAFLDALQRETELAWTENGIARDGEGDQAVLFIDTFETLAPLARWLRRVFLPQLPENLMLVLTGREPPPTDWRTDLGVQSVTHVRALRNLSREESETYLRRRDLSDEQRTAILQFAHGHPLALSLAADAYEQHPDRDVAPIESPDLVGTLVDRFLERVPSARHRLAVEACALVRHTTEPLLERLLDGAAGDLFDWLRGLSFIEADREGLFPHDVVRRALMADLRWRDADRHATLQQRGQDYYTEQLRRATQEETEAATAAAPERILTNYLYLYRDNPVVGPYFHQLHAQWSDHDPLVRDTAAAADWPRLRAMVEEHEGQPAAELLDYWRARQPENVRVFRNREGTPEGFVFPLDLHRVGDEAREADPCVEAACAHLEAEAPLREGERASLYRFWMSRTDYQDISPVQSLISAYRVRQYLTTPRLAYTFIPCANPDSWTLIFAYADLHRLEESDFTVGDETYGLFGHDWRVVPPVAWLELLADRDLTLRSPDAIPSAPSATMLVLSEANFADAVKDALKAYARPEALHGNPLLRSRFILEATSPEAEVDTRIEALRDHLLEAAESLQSAPKTAKYYRAVRATYLDPKRTQEKAAEFLGLPFSTYRRHLRRGMEAITGVLWRQEVGGD